MKKHFITIWLYLFSLILTVTAVVYVKQSPLAVHLSKGLEVVKAPTGV
ncbi:hypothetical protein [Chlorobaculum thiosulfatiphilum]|nr:hypothetical protein [Chlorobaculum thiosulfatiphilum]